MAQRFTSKKRNNIYRAIRYGDEPWRFVAALVAAVTTGWAVYPREWQGESVVTHFLAMLAVYFFIAYAALQWMRIGTVLLDRRFPWSRFPNSRLAFQLLCCWLLPVLLVYALAHSVLSLPQFVHLARGSADARETVAVLVLSLTLACNIAYVCAYFIVLCRRLQQKVQQGLRLIRKSRERQRAYEAEIAELRRSLGEQGTADGLATDVGKAAPNKKVRILPDNPADGQYRHVTSLRTELIDFQDISEFEVVDSTVFIHRSDGSKEPAKERSLTAIEDATGGYFRKVGRNRAIGLHSIKRCLQRDGQFELTLLDDRIVMVSADYARQIEGWILSRISIEREVQRL